MFVLFTVSLNVWFLVSEKLHLQNAEDYKYLKQSNCYSITGVNDAEEFHIVMVHFFIV